MAISSEGGRLGLTLGDGEVDGEGDKLAEGERLTLRDSLGL